ncbi:hypothetical protein D3C75_506100 [compost metagenome]
MPKLIDADKIIAEMEERIQMLLRDPDPTYDVHPVVNALDNYIDRLKSDRYLPDPTPVQPDTVNIGDKVRHSVHPEYGVGVVQTKKNTLNEVYVTFAFTKAHFDINRLEVITDDQPTKEA